jgi:hypothetical protein
MGSFGPLSRRSVSLDVPGGAASVEYVDTNTAPASLVDTVADQHDDPLGLGYVATTTAFVFTGAQTWQTANDARFVRVLAGGTISKVGLQVEVSSGNISVGVFRKTGAGRTAGPGSRVATSGAVACPAVGYAEVSLGASVDVEPGDYLALSCDNTTASFMSTNPGVSRDVHRPFFHVQSNAHPVPSAASGTFGSISKMPLLVGVA